MFKTVYCLLYGKGKTANGEPARRFLPSPQPCFKSQKPSRQLQPTGNFCGTRTHGEDTFFETGMARAAFFLSLLAIALGSNCTQQVEKTKQECNDKQIGLPHIEM